MCVSLNHGLGHLICTICLENPSPTECRMGAGSESMKICGCCKLARSTKETQRVCFTSMPLNFQRDIQEATEQLDVLLYVIYIKPSISSLLTWNMCQSGNCVTRCSKCNRALLKPFPRKLGSTPRSTMKYKYFTFMLIVCRRCLAGRDSCGRVYVETPIL